MTSTVVGATMLAGLMTSADALVPRGDESIERVFFHHFGATGEEARCDSLTPIDSVKRVDTFDDLAHLFTKLISVRSDAPRKGSISLLRSWTCVPIAATGAERFRRSSAA